MDYSFPLQEGQEPVLPYAVVPIQSTHCEQFVTTIPDQLGNAGNVHSHPHITLCSTGIQGGMYINFDCIQGFCMWT